MQSGRRLTDLEPAGFARRASAFLVDLVVAGAALVLLLQLVLDPLRQAIGPGWARVGLVYITYAFLTVSLPVWLYFAGYESGPNHATPAKRWLGIEVAAAGSAPLSFGRMLLRTVVKLLPVEVAHVFLTVPANPFIDPLSGMLTIPALDSLGPSVLGGLLLALLLFGVILFTMLLHPDGRGAHDLLAGTFVIRAVDEAVPAASASTAAPRTPAL